MSLRDDLDAADRAVSQHPGTLAVRRIRNVRRTFDVWRGFARPLDELLTNYETDEETTVALIQNVGDRRQGEQLERLLDQSLLAYVAGLVAIVDQSRPIVDLLSAEHQKEAAKRSTTLLALHPEGLFLAKLRNYVLHYLAAPWQFTASHAQDQPLKGEISLSTDLLLEWDGWKGAKPFIKEAGDRIHLRPLICPHFTSTAEHTAWLLETAWADNVALIEVANGLIAERNLILTGGVTDGQDWAERVAHMAENFRRTKSGEPQIDYSTGRPIGG